MNVIDIVLGSLLLFGLIRGLFKGLFVEVASLLALILGIYGAIHFSYFAAGFLKPRLDWDESMLNIVAFAITFVIIVLAISLAGKALTKLADFAALGLLNRFLGAAFGLLKIGFILSIILVVFNRISTSIPYLQEDDVDKSILYEPVKSLSTVIFPTLIKSTTEEDKNLDETL